MEGRGGYGRGNSGSAGRAGGARNRQQDQNYRGGQYHNDGRRGAGAERGRGPHMDAGAAAGTGARAPVVGGYGNRPTVPGGVSAGAPAGGSYGSRPTVPGGASGVGPTGGGGVWTGRPWGPSFSAHAPSSSTGQQPRPQQCQKTERPSQSPPAPVQLNFGSFSISEPQSLSSGEPISLPSGENSDNKKLPMRRPDRGTLSVRRVRLLVNHFPVTFSPIGTIMHYDVDVQQVMPNGNQALRRPIAKDVMHRIREKLFADESRRFPVDRVAYDGGKNIFSAVPLPTGEFRVELSDGVGTRPRTFTFTIKTVNQLSLSKLDDYLRGNLSDIPRDVLQALDLVMMDNPSKNRIQVGRSFYSRDAREGYDLGHGIAAYRGFHQSLKTTEQCLTLCLDYSVLAFLKPLPVLEFLKVCIENLRTVDDITRMERQVIDVLKGWNVRVTHRRTNQKYTISGLSTEATREITFPLVDPDSQAPPTETNIVDYFLQRYEKRITYLNIPCLDLGKANRTNYVPMEFCVLVEEQRCLKAYLERNDKNAATLLTKKSLASPAERCNAICEMVRAEDGPYGNVARNFEVQIDENLTCVEGRILGAPQLKVGRADGRVHPVKVDPEKCHWNLSGKCVLKGIPVKRWALIDFTSTSTGSYKLRREEFIKNLQDRARKLGIHMEDPLTCHATGMDELSSVSKIDRVLSKVIADARHKSGSQRTQLQVVVCVMTERDTGYDELKWVSVTQIGVVTQCCLSFRANKGQDQYLTNLYLNINAKLGGSNVELNERFPHFVDEDHVMFIGADVNHPAAYNDTCPSIAAVVGTMNWPGANRYAARVLPQEHRKEKIVKFGVICRDLVNTYAQLNKVRPNKIIIFRDGVSDGQFDMVLNEELHDLKLAICDDHYQPMVTLVVAQKRHQTRILLDGGRGRGDIGNVPPGTVVDTVIVHRYLFDFYLCSHYGILGTSKPTHYCVLWDENAFTSDEIQKLIYNLCFTYALCTKPVSLVPPVCYADMAAYMGRQFQEVVMKQHPATSVSSSGASFDPSFYTPHPNLQNVMYFV